MIGVICYVEDSEETFFNDIVVWSKTAGVFGVDVLIMIDIHNMIPNYTNESFKEVHIVKNLEEALKIKSDYEIVYFDIHGDKILGKNFTHPKDNVIYLFGADTGEVTPSRYDHKVKLNIPKELWGAQLFAVAMYDRSLK